ncbi:hypothetical protein ACTXT7_005484 [Hymenolepis weldensis]
MEEAFSTLINHICHLHKTFTAAFRKTVNQNGNCFVSPLSVYSGLSFALCGSAHNSCDELLKALYLNLDGGVDFDSTMVVLGKALSGLLAGDESGTLVLANSLFLDSKFEASQGFKSALIQHFKADLEKVNFSSAAEEARNHINCWVANRTANKITELMPQGSVDTITRLVLACAVYFKGTWATAFSKESTKESPFYTIDGSTVNVPMMINKGFYEVARFSDFKSNVIKIPFKVHTMLIISPQNKEGLPDVVQALFDTNKSEYFKSLFEPSHYKSHEIELHMPKFTLCGGQSGSIDLKKPLSQMFLDEVFDQARADFSRITEQEQLYISKIVHQAKIEVDEEGAEATASTGIAISNRMLTPRFSIDHPFLFLIVTETGIPAFMGQHRKHELIYRGDESQNLNFETIRKKDYGVSGEKSNYPPYLKSKHNHSARRVLFDTHPVCDTRHCVLTSIPTSHTGKNNSVIPKPSTDSNRAISLVIIYLTFIRNSREIDIHNEAKKCDILVINRRECLNVVGSRKVIECSASWVEASLSDFRLACCYSFPLAF